MDVDQKKDIIEVQGSEAESRAKNAWERIACPVVEYDCNQLELFPQLFIQDHEMRQPSMDKSA